MSDENDLKSDIAAAFDKAEAATETPTPEVEAAPSPDTVVSEPIGERPRDDKGRFAPKIGEQPKEAPKAEKKVEPEKAPEQLSLEPQKPPEPPKPEAAKQEPAPIPPPKSFRPVGRESWGKVPREVQEEIHRVDKEARRIAMESAEARQTYDKFKETVTPFEPLIRAEGVEPMQAVGNLLRTAAQLATAPQPTKAAIVANIIKTYGIDIPTLDSILSGSAPTQPAYQAPNPAQFRDPRLDALLEQQTRRIQEQAVAALSDVENEEFFEDVREDMADLLEVASKRGVALSAKDAYNRAVLLHPEVSRVIEQRKAAAAQSGATQRAMAASSSVRPQPATGVEAPKDMDLRATIAAALDKASSR